MKSLKEIKVFDVIDFFLTLHYYSRQKRQITWLFPPFQDFWLHRVPRNLVLLRSAISWSAPKKENKSILSPGDVNILWRHFSFMTSFSIGPAKLAGSVSTMGRSFNFTYLFACVILFAVYAAPLEKENVDGQQLLPYGKWNAWISRWDRGFAMQTT